ncbi:MAG: phosphoenolpyruvate--protein phosphotransferase [Candidatus Limnocylindrales bacterium]
MEQQAEPRVGIVVVSHSARIAEGVVELARQMAGPEVRLIAAGGMADGSIGTDAALIAEAIAQADAGAGVLVLADLGSAVLSTKLALDMVDPDVAGRTRLSNGPIVEGAVVAAVQAGGGRSLDDVLREAEAAASMRKDAGDEAQSGESAVEAGPGLSAGMFRIEVRNPSGLHARPAAEFVKTASRFRSSIWLENLTRGTAPADARSPSAVLSSGVGPGHLIRVSAEGEDQDAALAALMSLAAAGFGEGEAPGARPEPPAAGLPPAAPPARLAGAIAGTSGAAGVALGPVWMYLPPPGPSAPDQRVGSTVADPRAVIRPAAAEAAAQLNALAARVRAHGRDEDAGIFEAQALIATDPKVLEDAVIRAAAGQDPATAVESAAAGVAARMEALTDALLAARGADFRDVGARIARIIRGESLTLPAVPSIAVAEDLPPSVAEEIPEDLLLGVAIQGGSATAHVVILARGRGIPAVVAVPGLLKASGNASTIAIDGETGEVALDPGEATRAEFAARAEALAERRRAAAALRGNPGATADGERVALLANIGGPQDSARALAVGAEGVGLFRTEFLFMKRQSAPSEAEQVAAYRAVFEAFGPDRPVVVRLADIGGDKALPFLDLPPEANPFLGVRAIRLAAHGSRELLLTQLRAIWRAAGTAGVTPHVMAAMVSDLADARLFLELRDEARAAVAATGALLPDRMVSGVMIEVPSAALLAPELARLVDFFSVGTNDLTQYTMAADRGNPSLSHLQDALHPAVLRLIRSVVAGADAAGIPVAVCGELGGDPLGALVLVGLGVDELSADAGSLDAVRAALAAATRAELTALATRALAAADAETVRAMARELLAGLRRPLA